LTVGNKIVMFTLGLLTGATVGYVTAFTVSSSINNSQARGFKRRFANILYANTSEDILGDSPMLENEQISSSSEYPDPVNYPTAPSNNQQNIISAWHQLERMQSYYEENPDPMYDIPNVSSLSTINELIQFDE